MNVWKMVPAVQILMFVLAVKCLFPAKGKQINLTAGKTAKENLMKKILFLGAVAVLLSLGLVLVSCGKKCDNDGNCKFDPSSLSGIQGTSSCSESDCAVTKSLKGPQTSAKCDC